MAKPNDKGFNYVALALKGVNDDAISGGYPMTALIGLGALVQFDSYVNNIMATWSVADEFAFLDYFKEFMHDKLWEE
ncbi:hypothetical protein [Levilactobacillus enshiensis]|uniref:hypothetical protein n=1 Tax=Levilactobacillus enshiensis TaxID=2590213 RepID=UPI00117B4788|nr:hypothetical protein [Levilactobacillus enshiensis]